MEGNTTLYALPKADIVARWQAQTTDTFRFCFKFPATISHTPRCVIVMTRAGIFTRMSPLGSRIGQYWLQLPATFSPRDLPALWQFLDTLPKCFTYGVEVRHPDFFAKGEAEQLFNRGLHERGVNRVILDSRPVHAAIPHTEAIRDAQRKKPKVPVHAVVTANHPMVRFIGSDDMAQNSALFAVWLTKLSLWQHTTTPYLFCIRRTSRRPRSLLIRYGQIYAMLCQRSDQHRLFHSNLLFSENATYHSQCQQPF